MGPVAVGFRSKEREGDLADRDERFVEKNTVKLRFVAIGLGIVLGLLIAFLQGLVTGYRARYSTASVMPMSGSSEIDAMPGSVQFRGTWVREGEQQASPLQTTVIECDEATRHCTGATATITRNAATVDLENFDVLEWSEARVLLRETEGCVEYLYTLDLSTRSATGLRKPLANRTGCDGAEQKELRLTLLTSSEATNFSVDLAEPL